MDRRRITNSALEPVERTDFSGGTEFTELYQVSVLWPDETPDWNMEVLNDRMQKPDNNLKVTDLIKGPTNWGRQAVRERLRRSPVDILFH